MSQHAPGTLVHALRRFLDVLRGDDERPVVTITQRRADVPPARRSARVRRRRHRALRAPAGALTLPQADRVVVDARHRFALRTTSGDRVSPMTGDAAQG